MTITVTPVQAAALAGQIAEAQRAAQAAQALLAVLTLGHAVPADAVLADINTDTGTLTFHVETPNAG